MKTIFLFPWQDSICIRNLLGGQLEEMILRATRGWDVKDNRFCIKVVVVERRLAFSRGGSVYSVGVGGYRLEALGNRVEVHEF